MILPIRCFTCNRVICDGKVFLFEENRDIQMTEITIDRKEMIKNKLSNLIKYFDLLNKQLGNSNNEFIFTPSRLNEHKKQEYINYLTTNLTGVEEISGIDEISKSSDFDLLNLLSIDKICCRRMFLGYVNMIDKIV